MRLAFVTCARLALAGAGIALAIGVGATDFGAVKTPTSPLELLDNVKRAATQELLLREDFYSEENLKLFWGGSRIVWNANRRTLRRGEVRGVEALFRNAAPYSALAIKFSWGRRDANRREIDSGKIFAVLNIESAHDSRLTVDAIESAFGAAGKVSEPYSDPRRKSRAPPMPATHRLGNVLIEYRFDNPKVATSVWFVIKADGTIDRFGAFQDER